MSILARLFGRPQRSAHVAEERLRLVLAYERALVKQGSSAANVDRTPRPKRAVTPSHVQDPAPMSGEHARTEVKPVPYGPQFPIAERVPMRLVRGSIHSGERVHYPGGLMVLGDVHPAAQLVADGDIIVFGKLRGVAHAGASGNEKAVVAALVFAPTQARIGTRLLIRRPARGSGGGASELARVSAGQIVVEPWQAPGNDSIAMDTGGM